MTAAPVVVVGAGWAGLAAAIALTRDGVPVTLFDANPRPGGRARTAPALGIDVDNGQHIAIGAYHAVLALAAVIGLAPERMFRRLPLALEQRDADGVQFSLRAPCGAGRARLALAFMTARGLGVADKFAIARNWSRLTEPPSTDMPVTEFLAYCRQPRRAVALLWEPLCLATLNTAPAHASARLFARVLRDAFASDEAGAADLLLPACDLGAALPQPAVAWLERNGADVRLGERVTGIIADDAVRGVTSTRGETAARGVVLAVPPDACGRLIADLPTLAPLAASCARIGTQPICTVYLRYPADVRLPQPLVGLSGSIAQWLVDRDTCAQSGVIGAVISADGPHMALDNESLVAVVADEIARRLPDLPAHSDARVIREKRATFAATVGIDAHRPPPHTAMPGLLLAGDWTATGLPATLEGAVRSGLAAADAFGVKAGFLHNPP